MKRRNKTMAALTGAAILAAAVTTAASGAVGAKPATHADGSAVASTASSGKTIVDWNQELLSILKTPGAQPATVHPTRNLAILHAAMYDAVASITHRDRPYLFEIDASRTARPDAAADQAAHDTLVALYPSMRSTLDHKLADTLASVPSGPDTQAGIRVGHLAATLMLAARADDGSAATAPPFSLPAAAPGAYQLTPPNHPMPVFTNWGTTTPFVIGSGDEFRPLPPPDLTSLPWAQAITEVQRLGQDTSTARTPDQTTAAKFWAPPIWTTWNEIADGQVVGRRTSLEQAAKMLASLNLTFADTTIALYDAKYHFEFWRPITAIRAGTPGNPDVTTDPTWNALATTAPDPSYPGAHSSISAAAAVVLASYLGSHVDLTGSSDAMPGATRHFDTFQAAATEAGLSRIYAGQHTRLDHDAGVTLGNDVAHLVLNHATSRDF
jgi:membrane-associated phospholipid phosphatase